MLTTKIPHLFIPLLIIRAFPVPTFSGRWFIIMLSDRGHSWHGELRPDVSGAYKGTIGDIDSKTIENYQPN